METLLLASNMLFLPPLLCSPQWRNPPFLPLNRIHVPTAFPTTPSDEILLPSVFFIFPSVAPLSSISHSVEKEKNQCIYGRRRV